MKKAISLFLALVLCLSLCACGSNYQKQAEEVAPKLDGKWGRSWTAPVGTMYQVYIFEFEDGNSGTAALYNQVDDTPMSVTAQQPPAYQSAPKYEIILPNLE